MMDVLSEQMLNGWSKNPAREQRVEKSKCALSDGQFMTKYSYLSFVIPT